MRIEEYLNGQRDEIARRLRQAMDAGGDRREVEHLFDLIETAWTGLLIANPRMQQMLGIGYFRGFHSAEPDHYVRQARSVLQIAKMNPDLAELAGLLGDYLDRFLELRRRKPEIAKHFARAVFLLSPDTVTMDIE